MLSRSTVHVPPEFFSRFDAMRSNVDLPHPDGPTTVTNSPGRIENEISSSARVPSSNVIETFAKSSNGVLFVFCIVMFCEF